MHLNFSYKKYAAISFATLIFSILNGYFIVPNVIKFMVKKNVQLRKGSQMRPMFENIPFPLDFKVHVFNVTNSEEILQGAKPKLVDIGPYVFEEWKLRHDVEDDKKADTMSYTLRNKFRFRPDLSNGLTGDEIVIVPHILIFGIVSVIKRERDAMLPFVVKGLKTIFNDPKTPFIKTSVMDFLFNGIGFTCDGDFTAKTLCTGMEAEAKQLEIVNETYFKFSILGEKNRTDLGRFVIRRGVKNIADLGRIVTFDNDRIQSVWDGDQCNEISGTDSTIFPPFLKPEDGLWTFTPEICMSTKSTFLRTSSYDGMPTRIYTIDFGDFKNEPEKHCFCNEAPDECPPRGTIDLFPCVKAPIYGSKPHFLDCDPALLDDVEGLAPNRSIHDILANFEPISGTPFEGYKRLQFNFEVEPIEEFEIMSKLRKKMLLPILWVEESVKLNKTYTNLLKYQLFLGMKINTATKWMGIIGGSISLLIALVMMYKKSSAIGSTTTTTTKNLTTAATDAVTDLKINIGDNKMKSSE